MHRNERRIYSSFLFFCELALFSIFKQIADGHGNIILPPKRGITSYFEYCRGKVPVYQTGDEVDYFAHFPGGSRDTRPGSGLKSQKLAAGEAGWTVYDPTNPDFVFRSGPCGDLMTQNPQEHLKGGRYYNGGKAHFTYKQGDIISFDLCITTHHNGFSEFRVCDADKCGGDITNECLKDSEKCRLLQRVELESCESKTDPMCGPIDRNYPERWYHPCETNDPQHFYGNGKILYKLPDDFFCDRCVVQHYWASANSCNPPGLLEYFTGNDGPNWGDCPGQGDAIGGYRRFPRLCGGQDSFTEEYYDCADISIQQVSSIFAPQIDSSSSYEPIGSSNNSEFPFENVFLNIGGQDVARLENNVRFDYNLNGRDDITFTCTFVASIDKVEFYIDNNKQWTESSLKLRVIYSQDRIEKEAFFETKAKLRK